MIYLKAKFKFDQLLKFSLLILKEIFLFDLGINPLCA